MTYYIFVENGKINGCGQCERLDENVYNCEVEQEIYEDFLSDNLKYIAQEKEVEIQIPDEVDEGEEQTYHTETKTVYEIVPNPDYEEQHTAEERKRLDALTLTPADVERALYKAEEMDFEDLKALIAAQQLPIDMKALAIEFRANNFYRGVVVGGIRLIDAVGALLGYTPADMDYLFKNKELPTRTE